MVREDGFNKCAVLLIVFFITETTKIDELGPFHSQNDVIFASNEVPISSPSQSGSRSDHNFPVMN
ncbi:hypothetical protein GCM10007392_28100 [Saccharospirillum salsuginis]|uniref:Uncharacterized protein n=1 Tax=Saccharospirillum salsuginis TaxID=418750 RepID=A0A918NBM3_9GAMM|nr:hypothetical protein GCM10007392_28100 [Saccharospirillum salsuginis]